jgi:hypothetical protein
MAFTSSIPAPDFGAFSVRHVEETKRHAAPSSTLQPLVLTRSGLVTTQKSTSVNASFVAAILDSPAKPGPMARPLVGAETAVQHTPNDPPDGTSEKLSHLSSPTPIVVRTSRAEIRKNQAIVVAKIAVAVASILAIAAAAGAIGYFAFPLVTAGDSLKAASMMATKGIGIALMGGAVGMGIGGTIVAPACFLKPLFTVTDHNVRDCLEFLVKEVACALLGGSGGAVLAAAGAGVAIL